MKNIEYLSVILKNKTIHISDISQSYNCNRDIFNSKELTVLLKNLEQYLKTERTIPYCFGLFMLEKIDKNIFKMTEGGQVLIKINIILSAIFRVISNRRKLNQYEIDIYENFIKKDFHYTLHINSPNSQFFKDYIIDGILVDNGIVVDETDREMADAFDFHYQKFTKMSDLYLTSLLETIDNSTCILRL